jgi:rubrerythrin
MQPEHKVFTLELDTRCIQCGYNLRGLQSDGKCPECSAAVADSVWVPPPFAKPLKVKLDAGQDVPCVHCGETVRSLTPLGRCVTCGAPT